MQGGVGDRQGHDQPGDGPDRPGFCLLPVPGPLRPVGLPGGGAPGSGPTARGVGSVWGDYAAVGVQAWASRPRHLAAAAALALPATHSAQSFPYPSKTTLKPPPNLPSPLAGAAPALACGLFLSLEGFSATGSGVPATTISPPSHCIRLEFIKAAQKKQSCAKGGNTYPSFILLLLLPTISS